MKYRCRLCKMVFDEECEGVKWHELHDDWLCPVCRSPKMTFVPVCDAHKHSMAKRPEKKKRSSEERDF